MRKKLPRITLRTLFFLLLGLLLLPALLLSFIGSFRAKAQEEGLEQVRMELDGINQEINLSVIAPFYMSPRSFDPCDPNTLNMVKHPNDWVIEIGPGNEWRAACEWGYYKNGILIAIDSWSDYDRKLSQREYFRNESTSIARDIFFVLDNNDRVTCIKQREYDELNVVECYSESGVLVSIDPINNVFSPLPPMLYWFAYR